MYEQYPLSPNQESMAVSSVVHSGSGTYVQQQVFYLVGDIDSARMRDAWCILTDRHQVLRSSIHLHTEDGSVLRVWSRCDVDFHEITLTADRDKNIDNELRQILADDRLRAFDLSTAPLVRIRLIKHQEQTCTLVISHHHSVLDGASRQMILRELFQVCRAASIGDPVSLTDRPSYSEFGQWLKNVDRSQHYEFWKTQSLLKNVVSGLPGDISVEKPGMAMETECNIVQRAFSEVDSAEFHAYANRSGVRLPILFISAWCVLLSRYNDTDKVAFGLTRAGRHESENDFSKIIGALISTIPLAVDLSGITQNQYLYETVQKLVKKTRECEHTDLSILREILDIPKNKPLFNTVLVINRNPYDLVLDEFDDKLQLEKTEIIGYPDVPIFLQIYTEPTLRINFYYNVQQYSASFADRVLQHYCSILEKLCREERGDWRYTQFLDSSEYNKITKQWNKTEVDYGRDCTVGQLFQFQVDRTPSSVAIECEGKELTFDQLNQKANRLANKLRKLGVGPDVPVGIHFRRTLDQVVAIIGVLKAGGAIVPLDPEYPQDRLKFMLQNSGASICLSSILLTGTFQNDSCDIIYIDDEELQQSLDNPKTPTETAQADSMIYVLYTSGSTGTPKGVMGLHRGTINRCSWMWRTYPFGEKEVCCLITSISFVDSVWELFGPLLRGVRVVLLPENVVKDPEQLVQSLSLNRITRLVLVPSLLRAMLTSTTDLAERLPDLKLWITSGERLPDELYAKFQSALPKCTLLNLYGSSEVSADVTACELTLKDRPHRVSIGRPIANTQIYILDRYQNPVPVGVAGELYVGGEGLARGYFNQPELTSKRFVKNPFDERTESTLFRTGDFARYWENGEIEYQGRVDNQVKIRGFRVEVAEIEAALCDIEGVYAAAVICRESATNQKHLAAFYQPSNNANLDPIVIRDVLKQRLPDYMIPATFTLMDAIPSTPSGKVDRLKLANEIPERRVSESLTTNSTPDALQRNEYETTQRMVEVWQEVIGVDRINAQDDFFDLGGHSLLAVELILKVNSVFGAQLPIKSLYEAPTPQEISRKLKRQGSNTFCFTLSPVEPNCSTPPLFLINGLFLYRELARHLGANQPTYGIYVEEEVDAQRTESDLQTTLPFATVELLANRYITEIRTIQPKGPYQLGGESFGGVVAFEIAQQLINEGEKVALLALFDTNAPGSLDTPYIDRLRNHLKSVLSEGTPYIRKLMDGILSKRKLIRGAKKPLNGFDRENVYSKYQPCLFPGSIVILKASENDWIGHNRETDLGWGPFVDGNVNVHQIPGNHLSILQDPNVRVLAEKLGQYLKD